MDTAAWVGLGVALVATSVLVLLAPVLKRGQLRRQLDGRAPSGGIASGLDAVWRPTAEDAHAEWEASVELPAPAPSPGDKGRMGDGRIVIEVPGDREAAASVVSDRLRDLADPAGCSPAGSEAPGCRTAPAGGTGRG